MNFEIIPNQQTPGLPELPIFDSSECNLFIEKHRVELDGFFDGDDDDLFGDIS